MVELKWMRDDPVCVWQHGEMKLVIEVWVNDILETGVMADANQVCISAALVYRCRNLQQPDTSLFICETV